jgi:CHAD domain-containing protein
VDINREVETKLSVPEAFVMPPLVDVKGIDHVAVRRLRLKAVYVDSEDLRLARAGTTLRHRTGEGKPIWTLKLANSSVLGLDRLELSVPGPGTRIPAGLVDLLTARLRGAPLVPTVELRTHRTSALLFDSEGSPLVDVVDDRVEVVRDGHVVTAWRELEVEQHGDDGTVAQRVVKALQTAGARIGDQTPKAIRALGHLEGPDLPAVLPVRAKDPAGDLVRRSLAAGLAGLVEHDVGVRRGTEDAVHQLRVSCRRLRSDLRSFRSLLPDPRAEGLRAELSWLAGSFGDARDTEVLRERLRTTAAVDPLCPLDLTAVDAVLATQEEQAVGRALEALRSVRYLAILQLLHDLASGPELADRAAEPCEKVFPPLVAKAWKQLLKQTKGLALLSPDDDWHQARILAKRARYTAETAQEALGKVPRAKAAKAVQTSLGLHQDAVITADRCLALAATHPELAVTCARLAERERAHVRTAREAFLVTSA